MSKKYFVYVIKSREGHKYTGLTENLELRLNQHNNKLLSFWTKRGTDWKLIHKEEFDDKAKASVREKWLKSGAGRDFLKKFLSNKKTRHLTGFFCMPQKPAAIQYFLIAQAYC